MPWFVVDDRFHGSEPVKRIPRASRAAAIGLWTLAGAWSAQFLKDGYVPGYLLDDFGGSDELAGVLIEAGLWRAKRDGFVFVDWKKWQRSREDIETARQAERDRKAAWRAAKAAKAGNTGVSPVGQAGDTQGTDASVRSYPSHPIPTQPSKARKRGTRVPGDFTITDEMRSWAKSEAPLVDLDAKLGEWIDYWTGAPNGVKVDWISTWRNGMRKQQEFAERDLPKGPKKISPQDEWKYNR